MIWLTVFLLAAVLAIVGLVFLLGFRLGGHSWQSEALRVRAEAAAAERELHDLTRSAFVAMAEEAQRRRSGRVDEHDGGCGGGRGG
jgi:hypothetical protein